MATTDYILLQDEGDATSYKLKTPRFDTDHRLVKASLKICSKKEHKRYLNKRTTFPIQVIPQNEDGNEGDRALGKLQVAAKALDEEKEKKDPAGMEDSWISKKSFSLMHKKGGSEKSGLERGSATGGRTAK
jgi:hypothetical protein